MKCRKGLHDKTKPGRCKSCLALYRKKRYQDNPEKHVAYSKKYSQGHTEKIAEYKREYYQANIEKSKDMSRKTKYGISPEEYNSMKVKQNNLCAICSIVFNRNYRETTFHVDHCHATNIIRGLLCGSCNKMLGNAKDNLEILRHAADYLEKYI